LLVKKITPTIAGVICRGGGFNPSNVKFYLFGSFIVVGLLRHPLALLQPKSTALILYEVKIIDEIKLHQIKCVVLSDYCADASTSQLV